MTGNASAIVRFIVVTDQGDDLIVEDEDPVLELAIGWAIFSNADGIALAIPSDRVRSIQRIYPEDAL